ncbi:hypothetical protein TNCV_3863081 [Trichonephila clavipes]|uniref:Uncharacterized protein n=1 Tax=Trichonephila clavipes TaxID=2585209 RepID=A0A8X6VB22_TRICX|nr:hypothetical protein TNCV_3863081 [Trichonephila clavipes]
MDFIRYDSFQINIGSLDAEQFRRMCLSSQIFLDFRQREHVKSFAALFRAFMVKVSISVKVTDSESDMDLNSKKSGYTYKSRSSRSDTSKSTSPVSDYQKLKKTMEKIQVADQAINFFENQTHNPTPGDPTHVYISLLAQSRQERETLSRAWIIRTTALLTNSNPLIASRRNKVLLVASHWFPPSEATPPPTQPRTQHQGQSLPDMERRSLTRFQPSVKSKREGIFN